LSFKNGSVYDEDFNLITSEGEAGLQKYLNANAQPKYQTATVDGKKYKIEIASGNVTDEEGAFVTDGGMQGLQAYFAARQATVISVNGKKYREFKNGTVLDEEGKVICEKGGEGCLMK